MSRKYTTLPSDAFQKISKNAGILLSDFDPSLGTVTRSDILGATTGGISFKDTPSFTDYGEDIDNCPKNTKELKEIESREVVISGTFVTIDTYGGKRLIGAADIDVNDNTKIVPRDVLVDDDFIDDIWIVTDYSDVNGGFVALHIKNALSTGGFSIQTADKNKGQYAFSFTAHYTMSDPDDVPYELYIQAGNEEAEWTKVTLTNGFEMGVTYYTRSGAGTSQSPYVYTKVTSGAAATSGVDYYVRS